MNYHLTLNLLVYLLLKIKNFYNKFFLKSIFFLLFFLFSCKKENEKLIIKGYTKIIEVNQNISNVMITLYGLSISSSGTYQTIYEKIVSTYSNSNGYFEMNFSRKNLYSLVIEAYYENFFVTKKEIDINIFNKNNEVELILEMHPKTWLNICIKNLPPFSQDDQLYFNLNYDYKCDVCCHKMSRKFVGIEIDTNWFCEVYSYNKVIMSWGYENNFYLDTIYALPFDTIAKKIFY